MSPPSRSANTRTTIGRLLFLLLCTSALTRPQSEPAEPSRYPNELIGYRLFAEGKWKSLEPYVSKEADVRRVLGEPSPVLIPYDSHWDIIVFYFGEATINGRPWGKALKGTIAGIRFLPRFSMSFHGFVFPPVFTCSEIGISHSPARVTKCSDRVGLSYLIYKTDSSDKKIRAGDLMEIEYGPSDELEKKLQEQNVD
jgi:hypothetical protein